LGGGRTKLVLTSEVELKEWEIVGARPEATGLAPSTGGLTQKHE
jgi:hypothetical protein